MRCLIWSFCLTAFLAGPLAAEDGFQSLFNGKDLTGWDGNPEHWSVDDGVITGKTRGPQQLPYNQFLIWTGGRVSDFEFRVEFRLEGDNNSGVQYRSAERTDVGKWAIKGYQADMHSNPAYTGMLYDEGGRGIMAERGQKVTFSATGQKDVASLEAPTDPIDLTQWRELTIIAKGPRLVHKIDGVTTVEVIDRDEKNSDREGLLAFQVHRGPAMKVQFRNVRLKDLSGAAKGAAASATLQPEVNPKWLWAVENDAPARQVVFRREFSLPFAVKSAKVMVAADDQATVFLNGQQVDVHAGWQAAGAMDVTQALKSGKVGQTQVLAVNARNNDGPGGLLLQLDVTGEDGKTLSLGTDGSWGAAVKAPKGWKEVEFSGSGFAAPQVVAELSGGPWKMTSEAFLAARRMKEPQATPAEQLTVAKGFRAELLYSVPAGQEGSWVSMCTDPEGRLIVCDQHGGLFRVTPPGIREAKELVIEKIDVPIGEAQGLLWAFNSLYVVVNRGGKYESGLYRVTDADGDDRLDTVEALRLLPGSGGEHGPHGVVLGPDGQSLYVLCGNKTDLTELASSRVPQIYDEDQMLPRIYGKGFMKGVPAPGGYICKVDPLGKHWELVTAGFRNPYDLAFNRDGELFTYDADMEWDMNTPWYRPTRICHVLSGADYGWRNGSGKFPEHFADTLPPVVNIGPGSPTGICFGYEARFPEKYQQALFISDWSYGKMYAVHLQPSGSTYSATFEEFVTGTPLPLTDVIINPRDGAMYFAIGGRKVQSGLYRVTYVGDEKIASGTGGTAPVSGQAAGAGDRAVRHKLEALHLGEHPEAVELAWPHLSSPDRALRAAARTVLEHRPQQEWSARALTETNPQAQLEALLALCRVQLRPTKNPVEAVDVIPPDWSQPEPKRESTAATLQLNILGSLGQLNWSQLSLAQQLQAIRIVQLSLLRLGQPAADVREGMLEHLNPVLPHSSPELNAMMLDILVYLQSPVAVEKGLTLLSAAPSQEEQLNYAKALRFQVEGWTLAQREEYFRWFVRARGYRGGAGFDLFVKDIFDDAVARLTPEEKASLQPILDEKPSGPVNPFAAEPRPFVKKWTMEELLPLVESRLRERDYERGRKLFGAANCFNCHRFNNEGGAVGPDLTQLAGRFDSRAILESILEPSKVISDQYAAVQIVTMDGKVVVGRIVNLNGHILSINTNMMDPDLQTRVDRRQIEEMVPSQTSMMPTGLLDTLQEDEVLDLMAFLLSRGDRGAAYFKAAPMTPAGE